MKKLALGFALVALFAIACGSSKSEAENADGASTGTPADTAAPADTGTPADTAAPATDTAAPATT
jgi:hypothetical protein